MFRFLRAELEDRGGYSFTDSANRISCSHAGTRTRLRVIGSNARGAFGLVGCPWVIADEPGAWETRGGELLFDAIETAKGKPAGISVEGSLHRVAPAVSGWWHDLIASGALDPARRVPRNDQPAPLAVLGGCRPGHDLDPRQVRPGCLLFRPRPVGFVPLPERQPPPIFRRQDRILAGVARPQLQPPVTGVRNAGLTRKPRHRMRRDVRSEPGG